MTISKFLDHSKHETGCGLKPKSHRFKFTRGRYFMKVPKRLRIFNKSEAYTKNNKTRFYNQSKKKKQTAFLKCAFCELVATMQCSLNTGFCILLFFTELIFLCVCILKVHSTRMKDVGCLRCVGRCWPICYSMLKWTQINLSGSGPLYRVGLMSV